MKDFTEIGRQAYAAGQSCIPAFSPEVIEAIEGLPVGHGAYEIMKAWATGWTAANLADTSWME